MLFLLLLLLLSHPHRRRVTVVVVVVEAIVVGVAVDVVISIAAPRGIVFVIIVGVRVDTIVVFGIVGVLVCAMITSMIRSSRSNTTTSVSDISSIDGTAIQMFSAQRLVLQRAVCAVLLRPWFAISLVEVVVSILCRKRRRLRV